VPVLLCVAARGAAAQTPAWSDFERELRAYVQADGVIGASALYMRDGRVLQRVNIGLADRAANKAVTDSTLFHWGSITKMLTAIGIMQLRDRGKLSLDDRIVSYIPELRRVHDPYGTRDSITIRMLLSHTAGFQGST
jgi:CubicO group peptidase (beta-lactamase class C family)